MFNGGKIIKARILQTEAPKDRMNDDTIARVEPLLAPSVVSFKVKIPWILRGATGNLKQNDVVAVCIFDDKSGIIIDRMDGEWTGVIRGNVTVENGSFTIEDVKAGKADGKGLFVKNGDTALSHKLDVQEATTLNATLDTTGAATFAATVDAKGMIKSETDVSAPKCASLNGHTHTGNLGAPTSPPTA